MLEKVLIFVVFLGPLIFFHELGHFFFARFFGVKVEVFSIGFGPKIFKIVRGGTEYALSLIPLGGYVKMFGDDPFSQVQLTDEEKAVAFNHKSKVARFWIVFGGPLANMILAYGLYVSLLIGGEKVPETRVGVVTEKSVLFQKGFRTGDVLTGINDEKILSFDDLNIKGTRVEKVTVQRHDQNIQLPVDMDLEPFINEFVSVISAMKKPIFVNSKGQKYYFTPALKKVDAEVSLEELRTTFSGKGYLYQFTENNGKVEIDPASELEIIAGKDLALEPFLVKLGYFPIDLSVKNVVMGSPADKAGLHKDDIILSFNGKALFNFEELRVGLQDIAKDQAVKIEVLTAGKTAIKTLVPETKELENRKMKIIGVESSVEYLQPKLIIAKADSIPSAIVTAFTRTWDGIVKTFSGYKKLITREVSLNNIGGPLAIGKVASDSFNISLSMFFRLMAIISINLGVINLFPIPVLDGGHIMFLLFETFNGGPLSKRKLEIAQRLGVSVLFLLIFVALFNDISRLF